VTSFQLYIIIMYVKDTMLLLRNLKIKKIQKIIIKQSKNVEI